MGVVKYYIGYRFIILRKVFLAPYPAFNLWEKESG